MTIGVHGGVLVLGNEYLDEDLDEYLDVEEIQWHAPLL